MLRLITEYYDTLKMVERAKRQANNIVWSAVITEGEYRGKNFNHGGNKLIACPKCSHLRAFLHIYDHENKIINICEPCLETLVRESTENKPDKSAAERDMSNLSSASDSLRFAIEYMETGHVPGSRYGISRMSTIRREVKLDPQNYQFIQKAFLKQVPVEKLDQHQQELLNDLLQQLTPREKEAFELVRGRGYSFEKARQMMKVASRGTIQNLVDRAQNKLLFVVQQRPNSEGNISVQPSLKKLQSGLVQRTMFSDVM